MTLGYYRSCVPCERPIVIVSSRLRDISMMCIFEELHCGSLVESLRTPQDFENAYNTIVHAKQLLTDNDDLDQYYLLNRFDGSIEPCYTVVGCGHCLLCHDRKASDYCQRSVFQCEQDKAQPVFITLTYRNKYLPSAGVDKDALTRFVKRFKLYCKRYYNDDNVKIFAVSEYGSEEFTQRPHYHLLVYSFQTDALPYYRLRRATTLSRYCWSATTLQKHAIRYTSWLKDFGTDEKWNCHDDNLIGECDVQLAYNTNKVGYYVTKYLTKGSNVPEGKNPNFLKSVYSFGTDYVRKYLLPQVKYDYTNTVEYLPYNSNVTQKVRLTKYYIDYFFPTLSRLATGEQLRSFRSLDFFNKLYPIDQSYLLKIVDIELPHMFDCSNDVDSHCNNLRQLINKFNKKYYGSTFSSLLNERQKLLSSFRRQPIDKAIKLQKIHQRKQKQIIKL